MTNLVSENAFIGQDSFAGSPIDFSSPGSSGRSSPEANLPLSPSPTPSQELVVIKKEGESNEVEKKEEKPVKKRKSWGQQLPTPTTNLPPRKRAKTAEEKEQRRVERVLRNRAAAQKSREVKKQQLEKIELERDDLKKQNEQLKDKNSFLEALLRRNGIDFSMPPQDTPFSTGLPRPPSSSPLSDVLEYTDDLLSETCLYGPDSVNPLELAMTANTAGAFEISSSLPSSLSNDHLSAMQQPAALLCVDWQCQREISWLTIFMVLMTMLMITFVDAASMVLKQTILASIYLPMRAVGNMTPILRSLLRLNRSPLPPQNNRRRFWMNSLNAIKLSSCLEIS